MSNPTQGESDQLQPQQRSADIRRKYRLSELVDLELLQRVQDWFAHTHGLGVVIRDPAGRLVTQPSNPSAFCRTMTAHEASSERCLASHREGIKSAAPDGEPIRYTCHAGLTQVAWPIVVEGVVYGYIIAGLVVDQPLDEERVRQMAAELGVNPDELAQASRELAPWSAKDIHESVRMLSEITGAITKLCLRGLELQETVEDLRLLQRLTSALAASHELSDMLNAVTREVAEILDAKASIIRLFDEESGQALITASYGLSQEYLDKGPLRISQEITRLAPLNEPLYIEDVSQDPRVIYREDAQREGLRSSVGIALKAKGRAIGTLRVYTGEVRRFDEREMKLLSSIANQVALAIENARLIDRAHRTNVALRQAYTTLKSTQERLLESERLALVGRLAAGIAHEVGNPQASVYGIATTIRDQFDKLSREQIIELLDMIRDAAQRTTEIVQEVRSYARRPEDGWIDTDLSQVVDEVVAMARFDRVFAHVDIEVEYRARPTARIQPERIRQVLLNLMRNAAEAVQGDHGNIWVTLDQGDGTATIAVRDNGPGIPDNLLGRIWEPFFTTKASGTGLGLDICKQIVESHAGRIDVESELGEGSTFSVRLPVSPTERSSSR